MNHPRDLDTDRVVNMPPLPEHLRRAPVNAPRIVDRSPETAREPSYMERLENSIRTDPLKQIACTVCYLKFKDMVQLAKEICELVEAPAGSDAEVLALKFAVKMHKWAEDKFPAEA